MLRQVLLQSGSSSRDQLSRLAGAVLSVGDQVPMVSVVPPASGGGTASAGSGLRPPQVLRGY